MSTKNKKANYFYHNVIKPQLNVLIFGVAIEQTTASPATIVFQLTSVMHILGKKFQTNYILATNKTTEH